MNELDQFFVIFIAINLFLAISYKWSAIVLLKLFRYGRRLNPPEELDRKARSLGFPGSLAEICMNPTREIAERFLLWTGLINLLGAGVIYIVIRLLGSRT